MQRRREIWHSLNELAERQYSHRPRLTFGLVQNIVFGKVPTGIAGKRVCQSIPKEKSAKEKQYGIFLANSF